MSIKDELMKGPPPLTELDEKPEPASRGQLNNVDLVRVPYLSEMLKLPELERGLEVVKFLVFVRDHSAGSKLATKIDAAMKVMIP